MIQSKLRLYKKETCGVLALLLPIYFLSFPLFSNTAQATEFLTQYRVYNNTFDTLAEAEDYMRAQSSDPAAQLLQRDPTRDVYSSSTGMPTKFAYAIPEKLATVSGGTVTAESYQSTETDCPIIGPFGKDYCTLNNHSGDKVRSTLAQAVADIEAAHSHYYSFEVTDIGAFDPLHPFYNPSGPGYSTFIPYDPVIGQVVGGQFQFSDISVTYQKHSYGNEIDTSFTVTGLSTGQ